MWHFRFNEVYLRNSSISIRRRSRFFRRISQINDKTARDYLVAFCNGVTKLHDKEYLRKPTQTNVEKLDAFHEEKLGFPGSNNDINVICQSPLLNDLKVRKAPKVPFLANDVNYRWGYYITDGLYPE
ncbi:WAT1-related protein isoform X1 [Tanacetum coccineum]